MSARIIPCTQAPSGLCCMEDPDDPCFVPFIGPAKRKIRVRYSNRFTRQVRTLSGDPRWPLKIVGDKL